MAAKHSKQKNQREREKERPLFLPIVAAVLITPKGDESLGSGRIGVIGLLVFFSI